MAECSREAGADREQLGRRGPGEKEREGLAERGSAGLTDLVAAGRRVGVSDLPRSREVGAHPWSGVAAAGGCAVGRLRGCIAHLVPGPGQVFPRSGLFVLGSAHENLRLLSR